MPSPLPHLFSCPFVYQPSRTQVLDLSAWYFAHNSCPSSTSSFQLNIKEPENRNMPPGASETYIENHWSMLKHWISECHTLKSLELGFRQVLPLSEVIAEAGAVFETRVLFQAVKSCVAKWKGSTWFNDIFAPSSLPQLLPLSVTEAQCIRMCCCGKWSEWSNETLRFHNLAYRIFAFLPVLIAGPSWASRGRGSGFEQCLVTKASGSKLDFFSCFFLL